ncbi:hypothetical protein B7P34_08630 [Streptosporangium nondiastaticum]|uniref:Uncharacterized protein n=1 Tax=Streptosporangium nondiastaticum TaxID=35764 RepID=A0A9X7JSQ0_9ACTN|nr:hypothetical protein B7P34_08630 [Streptosporangium nondiastaticum]
MVDDERRLTRLLRRGTVVRGFAVDLAYGGREGLHRATVRAGDSHVAVGRRRRCGRGPVHRPATEEVRP